MQRSIRDAATAEPSQKSDTAPWTLSSAVRRCGGLWNGRLAVLDGTASCTFGELDGRCDAAAIRLRSLGVEPGDRILVLGAKDIDTLIVLLGISRAGATFVPVDARCPEERLRFFAQDAQPRLILCPAGMEGSTREKLGDHCSVHTAQEIATPTRVTEAERQSLPSTFPEDVAYVLYTSGSTGLPKGVQIEHGSVEAFLWAHGPRANIRPGDRCMNTSPCHFDVFVMDVLLPLMLGASVYLTHETPMPTQLLATIERYRITHFYAVGTVLYLMTGDGTLLDRYDLTSLRTLQTGAEVCRVDVVNHWLKRLPNLRLLNSYGPTEATVGCTSYVHDASGPFTGADVPIGTAHPEAQVVLMADDGSIVHGEGEGELLVGGRQVMRGYLNRPLEDRRVFVQVGAERFYRTGDYARRDDSGDLRYVGRRDDEVKINGLRVHLNEIRRCLRECSGVSSCAVGVVKTAQGARRLACVVVAKSPPSRSLVRDLQEQFSQKLPRALVPSLVGFSHNIPRLPSGKTDEASPIRRLEEAVAQFPGSAFVMTPNGFEPLKNGA